MRRFATAVLVLSLAPAFAGALLAQAREEAGKDEQATLNAGTFAGLRLRNIGPALMSGRISDIAIHPHDPRIWYVAVASGNVWKTNNAGTTWAPVFDNYGSYSIGCVTIDPGDPNIVWIGTGEDKSQRSVGFGDGVYKSVDGGKSFKNMGLKTSEHIARIVVDPRDSGVVYVAAQGSLWAPGGERGLFKTGDGGQTWQPVLEIGENTGVTDVVFDPRDPDTLYAASYQRRRHVWTLINGGPESAVYKSVDAGATWRTLTAGLPRGDVGKITMAVSPINPDVLYACIEAEGESGGFFRSEDRGESWARMSGYVSAYPMYFQEIFADPHVLDRVYSADLFVMVSDDGGRNFRRLGEQWKHVDNHAVAFFPDCAEHLLVGCDGGLYETWDGGLNYRYFDNLPVTQFYKVEADNDFPFYNVYGGTQDNATQGGPSRTDNVHGIRSSDWFIVTGGDGFQPRVDPENPDIVYGQSQYGNLVRFDKKSGEAIDIQPQPGKGEEPLRWNWDSPLIISPHSPTRLYFAAQQLWRSDDRGNSWLAVSPDLTRGLDRNQLKVMGRVWSVDAVEKNLHTSPYGNLVSLSESPLAEGLIYVGSDDGLIRVTENGGADWTKLEPFPGVPERSYVSDAFASPHDADTVYAAFNNHKMGDFKPYLLRSGDRGKTWTSIAGDLPDRHLVWCVIEDPVRKDLLFAGTEFGLFFSVDGGAHWVQLKGGVPTIPFRDLEIQERDGDLVGASFGRGFFILDDITTLRHVTPEMLGQEATLFPLRDALLYIPARPLGGGEKGSQGATYYTAPNPPYGAVFTYYLKESLQTRKAVRRQEEKKVQKEGGDNPYPTWEDLKLEDREEPPSLVLTVTDDAGNVVRRISGPAFAGFQRVAWDLRYPSTLPTTMTQGRGYYGAPAGPYVVPGKYAVRLAKRVDGEMIDIGEPRAFEVVALGLATLPAGDKAEALAFQRKLAEIMRALMAADGVAQDAENRLEHIMQAIDSTPGIDMKYAVEARELLNRLRDARELMTGDPTKPSRGEPAPPSVMSRIQNVVYGMMGTTSDPTQTFRDNYDIAAEEFATALESLRTLAEVDIKALEDALEAAGAPWTPGRALPNWGR